MYPSILVSLISGLESKRFFKVNSEYFSYFKHEKIVLLLVLLGLLQCIGFHRVVEGFGRHHVRIAGLDDGDESHLHELRSIQETHSPRLEVHEKEIRRPLLLAGLFELDPPHVLDIICRIDFVVLDFHLGNHNLGFHLEIWRAHHRFPHSILVDILCGGFQKDVVRVDDFWRQHLLRHYLVPADREHSAIFGINNDDTFIFSLQDIHDGNIDIPSPQVQNRSGNNSVSGACPVLVIQLDAGKKKTLILHQDADHTISLSELLVFHRYL
mmetsp:Transcript_11239/g.27002  ORF Transcript_11239/g.27002 Transcript_11239/m.27002 type:complete len:268 (+) Transcript_11239:187-990(+)